MSWEEIDESGKKKSANIITVMRKFTGMINERLIGIVSD